MVDTIRGISKLYRNDNRDVHDISYIRYFQPAIRGISTSIPFRAKLYFHHIIRSTVKTYTIHHEDTDSGEVALSMITWEDDSIRDITLFARRKQ